MTSLTINSEIGLQATIGRLRELFSTHKYLRLNVKTGKDRSLPQNSISHVWYLTLARELKEDDAIGHKCYCKLHHGVPILRAEDAEFRECYDAVIKPLSYEKKLIAMKSWPVTSIMTKEQISKYLESVRADFMGRGVMLEFPKGEE